MLNVNSKTKKFIDQIYDNAIQPNTQHIIDLLKLNGDDMLYLYEAADKKREKTMGNTVYLRGIIEFSNKYNLPFKTINATELSEVEGVENPSDIVLKYIGTPSVSEASALYFSKAKKLLIPKQKFKLLDKNMTCAVCKVHS